MDPLCLWTSFGVKNTRVSYFLRSFVEIRHDEYILLWSQRRIAKSMIYMMQNQKMFFLHNDQDLPDCKHSWLGFSKKHTSMTHWAWQIWHKVKCHHGYPSLPTRTWSLHCTGRSWTAMGRGSNQLGNRGILIWEYPRFLFASPEAVVLIYHIHQS